MKAQPHKDKNQAVVKKNGATRARDASHRTDSYGAPPNNPTAQAQCSL
ncbi:hypothetical protein MSP8886_00257 [Marinomonas spartinae]|uniref:Uncharacterized protein n=1 Tax=Marinomonas spartinae TaxID=1792290 RepID=A0A1A8T174_9GAMM|nr:hypothetical protein [Marinomonas spartinae]SBS25366.1 hypothetical protein MSP8886_00257 [Marinomonas spartinae]